MSGWTFASAAESIARRFVETLSLRPLTIRADLAAARGTWKGAPVTLSARAWAGDRTALFRVVILEGEGLEIANLLALPAAGAGDQIFGADLVAARPDAALVVADLSPVQDASRISTAAGLPPWAAAVFSNEPLLLRISRPERDAALQRLHRLADRFLAPRACAQPSAIYQPALSRYLHAHRADERTRGLLARIFGAEWTDTFIEQILYPLPGTPAEARVTPSRTDHDAA